MINLEIRQPWSDCVLAQYTDKSGMVHRLWFDETDGGRYIALAEVLVYGDDSRHFVSKIELPEAVEESLIEYCGTDEIYLRRDAL